MPESAAKVRLAVVLSVDQMRYDFLTRFAGLYSGGFKQLTDEGVCFESAMYRHASTGTGAGHATISTGQHPSVHGIVSNEWRDRASGTVTEVVKDAKVSSVPAGLKEGQASPHLLLARSLGDKLKTVSKESRVVSIAAKDRTAILMAGKDPSHTVLWLDRESGQYVTSSYYSGGLPSWVDGHNSFAGSGEPFLYHVLQSQWQRWAGVPLAQYYLLAGADDRPKEAAGFPGLFRTRSFPHALAPTADDRQKNRSYDLVRKSPYGDQATLDLARRAVIGAGLGKDEVPDLLCVGISATDFLGHLFGPRSHEVMDEYVRLDLALGDFIRFLDRRVGRKHYVLVLTSDHGVVEIPEHLDRFGETGVRVLKKNFEAEVRKELRSKAPDIAQALRAAHEDVYGFYLNTSKLPLGTKQAEAEKAIAQAIRSTQPAIAEAITASDLGSGAGGSPVHALFQNAYKPERSANVTFHTKEYSIVSAFPTGTGHGTAHAYDRHVPICFFGAGLGAESVSAAVGPEDIAPALAKLLGVPDLPVGKDGVDLTEAFD